MSELAEEFNGITNHGHSPWYEEGAPRAAVYAM